MHIFKQVAIGSKQLVQSQFIDFKSLLPHGQVFNSSGVSLQGAHLPGWQTLTH